MTRKLKSGSGKGALRAGNARRNKGGRPPVSDAEKLRRGTLRGYNSAAARARRARQEAGIAFTPPPFPRWWSASMRANMTAKLHDPGGVLERFGHLPDAKLRDFILGLYGWASHGGEAIQARAEHEKRHGKRRAPKPNSFDIIQDPETGRAIFATDGRVKRG